MHDACVVQDQLRSMSLHDVSAFGLEALKLLLSFLIFETTYLLWSADRLEEYLTKSILIFFHVLSSQYHHRIFNRWNNVTFKFFEIIFDLRNDEICFIIFLLLQCFVDLPTRKILILQRIFWCSIVLVKCLISILKYHIVSFFI